MLVFTQPSYHHFQPSPREQYLRALAEERAAQRAYAEREYIRQQQLAAIRAEHQRQAILAEQERRRRIVEARRQAYLQQLREEDEYIHHPFGHMYGHLRYAYDEEEDMSQQDNISSSPTQPVTIPISDDASEKQTTVLHKQTASREQQDAAAILIQKTYQAHVTRRRAISALSDLRQQLDNLVSRFEFPTSPLFSSDAPAKLLYAPANAPIHAYEDALMKLLSKLDAVESGGDKVVRKARKNLATDVEKALNALDAQKEHAWQSQKVEKEQEMGEEQEVEMAIRPEDVELPVSDDESEAASEAMDEDQDDDFEDGVIIYMRGESGTGRIRDAVTVSCRV